MHEWNTELTEFLAIHQMVDGCAVAAIYLDVLTDWAYEQRTNIFFRRYRVIQIETQLNRKQQDLALSKLRQKSWFKYTPESRAGSSGLLFMLDMPAIEAEFRHQLSLLEAKS
jgi:hypothetical protein